MIDIIWLVGLTLAGTVFFWKLSYWRWSACRCGRERLPYFARAHEKEWIMAVMVAIHGLGAVLAALAGLGILSVLMGLLTVYDARILHEHRKGKKSILGRLLGRVVVTEHGRLAVEQFEVV